MQQNCKRNFGFTGLFFVGSVLFTLLVKTVDVLPVGPSHSLVGFGALNRSAADFFGTSAFWKSVSAFLGLLAVAVALGFGLVGLIQWIWHRRLQAVNRGFFALALVYGAMAVLYVGFELFVVNFRPVFTDGLLEASYPSSHTLLMLCVFGTAPLQLGRLIPGKAKNRIAMVLFWFLAAVGVFSRTLSGVHWITDILGGLLMGIMLIFLYVSLAGWMDSRTSQGKS